MAFVGEQEDTVAAGKSLVASAVRERTAQILIDEAWRAFDAAVVAVESTFVRVAAAELTYVMSPVEEGVVEIYDCAAVAAADSTFVGLTFVRGAVELTFVKAPVREVAVVVFVIETQCLQARPSQTQMDRPRASPTVAAEPLTRQGFENSLLEEIPTLEILNHTCAAEAS